ncbi:MAG TPA: hypothetical protein VG146_05935 [Verrucomicrobiae bacterium]|nr:hypothetical protein [Verrucomicrobiae bacterium]
MNMIKLLAGLLAIAAISASTARAEDHKFLLTFTGACVSNAPSGSFAARRVNNQMFVQPYAQANFLPPDGVALVYHLNSDPRGDSIEVINRTNGAVLGVPLLLYFADDTTLGRMGLTNSVATQIRKIEYVYTSQNSHSMGSCLLNEHLYKDGNGTLTSAVIMGAITWIVVPDGTQPMQVYNGSIFSGKMIQ